MALHFKFLLDSSEEVRERLLTRLREEGAAKVHPLFEDETDPELASVYVAEGQSEETEGRLARLLERDREVEYVESAVRRKLIH